MTDETTPPPAPDPAEDDEPERQTTPFLVLQFFIFPMAIVAVCVAVFVIFGLVAGDSKDASDYLTEVRTGGATRRWQAAFELSKELQARKAETAADPKFVEQMIATFQEAKSDDPRVRRYLALALGRLGDRKAAPALLEAARPAGDGAADPETRIYSIWSLGALADPAAIPVLVELAADEDAGLRKSALHALGAFPGDEPRAALVKGLEDGVEDVRWNAALGLARHKDARATPVLAQMLDRATLSKVEGLRPEQTQEALFSAVAAAAAIDAPELRQALEKLKADDPDLKVREAARLALSR